MSSHETSLQERINYGLGDFAQNGMFTFISSYFIFFCTDIAQTGLQFTGSLVFLGRILDAFFTLFAGQYLDRIRVPSGKCRWIILRLALPETLLLVMSFALFPLTQSRRKAYLFFTYLLFSVTYAFVGVAYSALLSRISGVEEDRLSLNFFKNLGAALGGVLVTSASLKIVHAARTPQFGYLLAVSAFALLFLVALVLCVHGTKERMHQVEKHPFGGFFKLLRHVARCRGWLVLCFVNFAELFFYSLRTQSVMYYCKYYLSDETVSVWILSMLQIASVIVTFLMPSLSKRIGNKNCVILGNFIWCAAMIGNYLAQRNLPLIYFFSAVSSLGWAIATGTIFVMISDTSDLIEVQLGQRLDGFITATLVFVMKIGSAFASLILTVNMKSSALFADSIANYAVNRAILLNYIWIPLIASAAVIVCIQLYPPRKAKRT